MEKTSSALRPTVRGQAVKQSANETGNAARPESSPERLPGREPHHPAITAAKGRSVEDFPGVHGSSTALARLTEVFGIMSPGPTLNSPKLVRLTAEDARALAKPGLIRGKVPAAAQVVAARLDEQLKSAEDVSLQWRAIPSGPLPSAQLSFKASDGDRYTFTLSVDAIKSMLSTINGIR